MAEALNDSESSPRYGVVSMFKYFFQIFFLCSYKVINLAVLILFGIR